MYLYKNVKINIIFNYQDRPQQPSGRDMTDFNRPPNNHGFYSNQQQHSASGFHDNQPQHGYEEPTMGSYFGGQQRQGGERFAGPQKFMGPDEPDNGTSHWANSRFNNQGGGSMQFPSNMGNGNCLIIFNFLINSNWLILVLEPRINFFFFE